MKEQKVPNTVSVTEQAFTASSRALLFTLQFSRDCLNSFKYFCFHPTSGAWRSFSRWTREWKCVPSSAGSTISSWRKVALTGVAPMTGVYYQLTDPHRLWPLCLNNPQYPYPKGRRHQTTRLLVMSFSSWISPLRPSIQGLWMPLMPPLFLSISNPAPSQASLACPPDCLTAAPNRYPSSWISVGNEAQPGAGCGYWRKIKTLTKPFSGNSEGEFWSSAGEGGQQDKGMEVRFKE